MVQMNVIDIELWSCLFVIIYIQGGKIKIVNWNKNILVNYDWVCLVIVDLLASTVFMNLRSIFVLTTEKDLKVDCKT